MGGLIALTLFAVPAHAQIQKGDTREAQNRALDTLGHVLGPASARIEVVEFIDFGCSQCARFTRETFVPVYREFVFPGQVRWRTIPFVLGSFRHAALAAEAAECAGEQGRFLAMHDALLARQREWSTVTSPMALLAEIAKGAGVEPKRYANCLATERMRPRVRAHKDIALRLGIYGTPTFIVQRQQRVLGAVPTEQFMGALRAELAKEQ